MRKYLLESYQDSSLSIQQKTRVLVNGIWVSMLFMLITLLTHVINQLSTFIILTDLAYLGAALVLLYLIRISKSVLASNLFLVSIILAVTSEVPLRDVLMDNPQPYIRVMETEVLLVVGLIFVSLCAYRTYQIFIYSFLSILLLIAHFLVIVYRFHDGVIDSQAWADIIIYTSLFSIGAFISYYRYKISENLIQKLEQEATKVNILNQALQSQVQERTKEIEAKKNSLEKTNYELDYLVYRVSHDIRGPLVSALGLINLLKSEANGDSILQYLALLEGLVIKLDNFIREILDLSQNARTEIELDQVDFEELLRYCWEVNHFHRNFSVIQKDIELDIDFPFYTDRQRLQVILGNLISNALKFTPDDEKDASIHIHIRTRPSFAIIEIKDEGIGIKPEHQDHIFEMFYRATDQKPGSGLGLYIVKETLEKIGGEISFESFPNQGSTFKLKIPNLSPKTASTSSQMTPSPSIAD